MAFAAGQRVTNKGGRQGNVALDNSANVQVGDPGVIVLYADSTYSMEVNATLTNIAGSWIPGIGPGN